MKTKTPISAELKREIEVRAYLIWESEGHPHGREHEHWQRAEAEILGAAPEKPEIKAKPEKKTVHPKAEAKPVGKAANGTAKVVVAAKAKKPAVKAKPSKPAHS